MAELEGPPVPTEGEQLERRVRASRRGERAVVALLLGSAGASAAFVALYATGNDTQLLGIALALALALIAAALIVASRALVPGERVAEQRPDFAKPAASGDLAERESRDAEAAAAQTAEVIRAGVDGISRRKLIGAAGVAAGGALGAALIAPAASLGPAVGDRLRASPWRKGVRLVDEDGTPVRARDLETGTFVTAFPEGGDKRQLAAALVVVRVREDELDLPPDRADWAPRGLLAYSKICTHAGCAVNLYRSPLYDPLSPGPALVCPCHYSTFDVRRGGVRIFGPAGRPLPQLPLEIDRDGNLVAGGGFSGPVGPAWEGVRQS